MNQKDSRRTAILLRTMSFAAAAVLLLCACETGSLPTASVPEQRLLRDAPQYQLSVQDQDVPLALGTCPRGFDLAYVGVQVETTTFPENFARSMNGDGYLCYKQGIHPYFGDDFYIDNDIPIMDSPRPPRP